MFCGVQSRLEAKSVLCNLEAVRLDVTGICFTESGDNS